MTKRIPKIIHYCWFGGKALPDSVKKNILSWKKNCPEYQIIQWNEKNFNYNMSEYTKSAFDNKEWAFLSDYARLVCLYKYGGIYLDTDVEIIKNLDPLLQNKMFVGLENPDAINTGLGCGSIANNQNLLEILSIYNQKGSNLINGEFIRTSCVDITTDYFYTKGMKMKNKNQIVNGCSIYNTEFLCPQRPGSRKIKITNNTYSIHHFMGTWVLGDGIFSEIKYRMIFFTSFFRRGVGKILGRENMKKIQLFYREKIK